MRCPQRSDMTFETTLVQGNSQEKDFKVRKSGILFIKQYEISLIKQHLKGSTQNFLFIRWTKFRFTELISNEIKKI